MKKIILTCLAIVALSTTVKAQKKVKLEDNSNASNLFFKNDFLGINTTDPEDFLHIKKKSNNLIYNLKLGPNYMAFKASNNVPSYIDKRDGGPLIFRMGSNYNKVLSIHNNKFVGIGTVNPSSVLHVVHPREPYSFRTDGNSITFQAGGNKNSYINKLDSGSLIFTTGVGTNSQFVMTIKNNGNIGIGTTKPESKLAVKGKIRAEEIKVESPIAPDYVFQKYYEGKSILKDDYNMPSLEEVEAYAKANYHLPGIPSAKQLQEEGLQVGSMVNKLLQKIEELTLYTIEQQKAIKELRDEVSLLKDRN